MTAAGIIAGFFLLFAVLQLDGEPMLASDYAVTSFERCEQAYSGSINIHKCEEYK